MSDYPMLISNKLHSFRNFQLQKYKKTWNRKKVGIILNANLNKGALSSIIMILSKTSLSL